jgi:hypothetical protein
VQPHAERFAAACSTVDERYVANFGEEVVRGQPSFMLRQGSTPPACLPACLPACPPACLPALALL